MKRLSKSELIKKLLTLVYLKALDDQKTWLEATNRSWLSNPKDPVADAKLLTDSIVKQLPAKPKVAVDIGAGNGSIAINLALRQIFVIAVEPDRYQLEIMKLLLSHYPQAKPYIVGISGVAESLPIASSSVDLCICSQVLEHVNDPDLSVREIARVLKNNGLCHLSCPNYLYPMEQHYKIPYFPLMSKNLFSSWALFLYKTLNISRIHNIHQRDFSFIQGFISTINYTTHKMILNICSKHDLKPISSSAEETKSLRFQIAHHWKQHPNLRQLLYITISLPMKIARAILVRLGILPRNLEYILQKV